MPTGTSHRWRRSVPRSRWSCRMPDGMRSWSPTFATEAGLDWVAAYPGCARQSEPSLRTVAALVERIEEDGIPVVLHMEMANTMLSQVVAEETGAEVREFSSCHNVTRRQFEAGVTYVDLMKSNIEVLKEALN